MSNDENEDAIEVQRGFTMFEHYMRTVENLSDSTIQQYIKIWKEDIDYSSKAYKQKIYKRVESLHEKYRVWVKDYLKPEKKDERRIIYIETNTGSYFMDYHIESMTMISKHLDEIKTIKICTSFNK